MKINTDTDDTTEVQKVDASDAKFAVCDVRTKKQNKSLTSFQQDRDKDAGTKELVIPGHQSRTIENFMPVFKGFISLLLFDYCQSLSLIDVAILHHS